jgi:hypothetical protein
MDKKDEQIKRLLLKPKDYTINELDSLMKNCGCVKANRGKTSGSAIKYIHESSGLKLFIHEPNPGKILKPYVINLIIKFLRDVNEIK